MPEVITIGESMVMLIGEQPDSVTMSERFSRHLAGAESNVAIGLARLGIRSGLISAVGNDPAGAYIKECIHAEGVDTKQVRILPEYPTGMLLKEPVTSGDPSVYYYRNGSAASHMTPGMLQAEYFRDAKILHVTGIFPALSESSRRTLLCAIEIAKSKGMLVSFDPNIRLKLWSEAEARSTLLQIAQLSDLILPGVHEAELLTGTAKWPEVAEIFHRMGNRYVVMKNGADGAYYSLRDQGGDTSGYEKGFNVAEVIDTVGAGDGFVVGVLSALLDGEPFSQAVRRGNAIGSLAVMAKGDYEGYPKRQKLERYLAQLPPAEQKEEVC